MFDPNSLGAEPPGIRRGAILGKDEPRAGYSQLLPLEDGRLLVGFGGDQHPGRPSGFQVRAGESLTVASQSIGPNPPFAARPGGETILDHLPGGEAGSGWPLTHLRLLDLSSGEALDRFPLHAPFVWLDKQRFIAQLPAPWERAREPEGDAKQRERHVWLFTALTDAPAHGLAVVDLEGRSLQVLDTGWTGPLRWGCYRLTADLRGGLLYCCDWTQIAAIDLHGATRWVTQVAAQRGRYSLRSLAVSPDGRRVAAIADPADPAERALVVLDAETGAVVHERAVGHELAELGLLRAARTVPRCLAWHPAGWLAVGTGGGIVAHLDPEWNLRAYRAAPRSVEAVAFTNDGRSLLAAGSERALRRWELRDDELA